MALAIMTVSADEELDVLFLAMINPADVTINGTRLPYGDRRVLEAEMALKDIPRPWTVPKLIKIFERESQDWSKQLKEKIDACDPVMWPNHIEDRKHLEHLATLLAVSRDPRAILVLGNSLETQNHPAGASIEHAFYTHLVFHPDYHAIEIKPSAGSTGGFGREAKNWWSLNKKLVLEKVHSQEATNK